MSEPYRGGTPTAEQVDAAVQQALAVAPVRLTERDGVDLVVNVLGSAAHPNAVLISRQLVQERLRLTGWQGWVPPEPVSLQDRVRAFHERFGFHVGADPMRPPPDRIRFERAGLIAEECGELITELTVGLPEEMIREVLGRFTSRVNFLIAANEQAMYDPLRVMREAADVHVGILGLGVNGAFDLDRATEVVCESNLTRSGPDERGMACKGPGFVAPDMRRVLPAPTEEAAHA